MAFLFVMRLTSSGRDFTWIYDRQDQVPFIHCHVRSRTSASCRVASYDNLRPAQGVALCACTNFGAQMVCLG